MPTSPTIDVVVPAFNEAAILRQNVEILHGYLTRNLPYPFTVTITESGSADDTLAIAHDLADQLPDVRVVSDLLRGRGQALRRAWESSTADIVAYIDADLSISLDAFLPLLAPIVSGHSPIAIGTRHAPGSRVTRSTRRAVLSRTLNLLLRTSLQARFTDAQCGFKAGRRDVITTVMSHVQATHWFFDTELLVVAQRLGVRIHEVPVDCLDDPRSSVDVLPTISNFLTEILRLAARPTPTAGETTNRYA